EEAAVHVGHPLLAAVAAGGGADAVGAERLHRVEAARRADPRAAARLRELPGVPSLLVGGVHPAADELDLGALEDRAQREVADEARPELHHAEPARRGHRYSPPSRTRRTRSPVAVPTKSSLPTRSPTVPRPPGPPEPS